MWPPTCGNDCLPFEWTAASNFLGMSSLVSGFFIVTGLSLAFNAKTMDYHVLQGFLDHHFIVQWQSLDYPIKLFTCSFLQYAYFTYRSYSRTYNEFLYVLEFVAEVWLFLESSKLWARAQLQGITTGLQASCGIMLWDSFILVTLCMVPMYDTWFSFSFFGILRVMHIWNQFTNTRFVDLNLWHFQVIDLVIRMCSLLLFAASLIMVIENLGEPQIEFLKSNTVREWTTFNSIYYILTTCTTIGFGDIVPLTGLGRLFSIFAIFGGIGSLASIGFTIIKIARITRTGRGDYPSAGKRYPHLVILGNPDCSTLFTVLKELFHEDRSDDSEDLQLIILFSSAGESFHDVQGFLKRRENLKLASRIYLLVGDVLDHHDRKRIAANRAQAFLILPNMNARDLEMEDRENIVRTLALRKYHPHVRCILLLHKSEYRYLVGKNKGEGSIKQALISQMVKEEPKANQRKQKKISEKLQILAVDEMKFSLIGKSTQVPSFQMMICNLVTTNAVNEDDLDDDLYTWQREYYVSLGLEIYEEPLSNAYAMKKCSFGQVVLDILERTSQAFQTVYLIGLIEIKFTTKDSGFSALFGADDPNDQIIKQGEELDGDFKRLVIVNPGPHYMIKQNTNTTQIYGIFIASDRESIMQMRANDLLLSSREEDLVRAARGSSFYRRTNKPLMQAEIDPAADLSHEALTLEVLQKLEHQKEIGDKVKSPPDTMLAKGGHVLICVVGLKAPVSLGLKHFCKHVKDINFFDENPMKDDHTPPLPIVILAETVPKDWVSIAMIPTVYFVKGNPLMLFDLERVNFREANVIFITKSVIHKTALADVAGFGGEDQSTSTGGETGTDGAISAIDESMVDSEVIFCTRFIESQLRASLEESKAQDEEFELEDEDLFATGVVANGPIVITELSLVESHQFLPFLDDQVLEERFVQDLESTDKIFGNEILGIKKVASSGGIGRSGNPTRPSSRGMRRSSVGMAASVAIKGTKKTQAFAKQTFTKDIWWSIAGNLEYIGKLIKGGTTKKTINIDPNAEKESMFKVDDENNSELDFMRFPRYACGALFLSTMFPSLCVGSFYNPSLPKLIDSLVEAEQIILMVPSKFVGRNVVQLYEWLFFHKGLMLLGIYRQTQQREDLLQMADVSLQSDVITYCRKRRLAVELNAKLGYLYLCPSVTDTYLNQEDRILCLALSDKLIEKDLRPMGRI